MTKRKLKPRRKNFKSPFSNLNFLNRGSITFKIIISVILIGSVMFLGGIFPKNQITPRPEGGGFFIPVDDDKKTQEDALQLKTLKFKQCGETAAVNMMLDRSGSMKDPAPDGERKIDKLKTATLSFVQNLSDDSVIGLQSFDSYSITSDVPISIYKDVKPQVDAKIKALQPGGQTPTSNALKFSLEQIRLGVQKYPGRKFAFIFVSDGQPVPETQDPRLPQNAPDPSGEIKKLGVTIYSIGILDKTQITQGTMKDLLDAIASSPDKSFIAPDGSQLTEIYNQIRFQLCGEAK